MFLLEITDCRTDQSVSKKKKKKKKKTCYLPLPHSSIIVLSTVMVTSLQSIQQVGWSPLTLLHLTLVLNTDPGHPIGSSLLI